MESEHDYTRESFFLLLKENNLLNSQWWPMSPGIWTNFKIFKRLLLKYEETVRFFSTFYDFEFEFAQIFKF